MEPIICQQNLPVVYVSNLSTLARDIQRFAKNVWIGMKMNNYSHLIFEKKVIIKINKRLCETPEELIGSELFLEILNRCIQNLLS